eukprot:TRINITY_DN3265_c0_g3_i1.p1 TRINITY_DN3265_c0_g3~~TRINITY_DN3265_c0_g3_i1.p1  ORF type:complete len:559 (-),score=101.75 TRINITY_DN3265_c0_g3_i1:94-1770(-)
MSHRSSRIIVGVPETLGLRRLTHSRRWLARRQVFGASMTSRGVANRVHGAATATIFRRVFDSPTMDSDAVVATLDELVAERNGDARVLQALSLRFRSHAEEFFPPQIDSVLASFAELSYSDEALLHGFAGRLDDMMSDASPRRVVRVLRNGAKLRFPPHDWLDGVLPQLHRHMPNLREGVPSCLASLHALRWNEPELVELLLTQGLIVAEELGDAFFTRVFETWSRHGVRHANAEKVAVTLVTKDFDLRDSINLLAGLRRCSGKEQAKAADGLEQKIVTLLNTAPIEQVVVALTWMQRLSFQSTLVWRASADAVELALQNRKFVRDQLPIAAHALASVLGESSTAAEAALLVNLLRAKETTDMLPRYQATQLLHVLHATAIAAVACGPGSASEKDLASSMPGAMTDAVTRLTRQLTLPERRCFWQAAIVLQDVLNRNVGKAVAATTNLGRALDEDIRWLAPLPALTEGWRPDDGKHDGERLVPVEAGAEALLRPIEDVAAEKQFPTGSLARRAVKFLGSGDHLAGPFVAAQNRRPLTLGCRLSLHALSLQGWEVDLRP